MLPSRASRRANVTSISIPMLKYRWYTVRCGGSNRARMRGNILTYVILTYIIIAYVATYVIR